MAAKEKGAFKYCVSCGTRYSQESCDGGRCTVCYVMVCAVDCSTETREQRALQKEADEMLDFLTREWGEDTLRRVWEELSPKRRARFLRMAHEERN